MVSDHHDIALLVRSNHPLLVVETAEEQRAVELFRRVLTKVWRPMYSWTITDGLCRMDLDMEGTKGPTDPTMALQQIKEGTERGVYLLLDFHPYIKDAVHIRLIREIAQEGRHCLVMICPEIDLPPELDSLATPYELKLPNDKTLERLVRDEVFRWSKANDGRRVEVSPQAVKMLVQNLLGLTIRDARRLARSAINDDGALTESDIPGVMAAKFKLLSRDGVLQFEYDSVPLEHIAGMSKLKDWLRKRRNALHAKDLPPGLDPPRGVLLLGVQGCGKSMAARAAASAYGVPLLRMDVGALYNKYHGESERNLREALASAEAMAPCVLWIDEIEKGLATSDSDGGTSQRVLGTMLTWMAEAGNRVFIVATANQIDKLPAELLRKGRFDEIFFVDLPCADLRKDVFAIHLQRREQAPERFDLNALADLSAGFSGAEIEQVVVSALYDAHAENRALDNRALGEAIAATRPLSVIMAENVQALREWASDRTVPVD